MPLDLATIVTAQYARLASDSAGSAVRAALGAGSASVIHARTLDPAALPAAPFVAYRERGVAGESWEMRPVLGDWWIYDLPTYGTTRINALITLIHTAYPRAAIAHCETVVSNVGAPIHDTALDRIGRAVSLTSYTRG